MSACAATTDKLSFTVVGWNPLAHDAEHFVRLPVTGGSWRVVDSSGALVPAQIAPIDARTLSLPLLYLNSYGMCPEQVKPPRCSLRTPSYRTRGHAPMPRACAGARIVRSTQRPRRGCARARTRTCTRALALAHAHAHIYQLVVLTAHSHARTSLGSRALNRGFRPLTAEDATIFMHTR
eukprot:6201376-Pleurochrysis_carterae.AAC.3